jgi:hypothetical protein
MPLDVEEPLEELEELEEEWVDRAETGIRALKTLLFFIIARVVEAVLGVLIIFELIWTLITGREPSSAVRRFASRVLAYLVEIVRYLTYNDDQAPFPFREFPGDPKPDAAGPAESG